MNANDVHKLLILVKTGIRWCLKIHILELIDLIGDGSNEASSD